MANTKGPKKIWVPKKNIFTIVDVLDSRKQMPIMILGQWLLTAHDRRKEKDMLKTTENCCRIVVFIYKNIIEFLFKTFFYQLILN